MGLIKKLILPATIIGGICALVALSTPKEGMARKEYKETIPNSKVYGCKTCHGKSFKKEELNSFGTDYMNSSSTWNDVLAKKDSDADGKTNGWELGDEEGTWKKGDKDPEPGRQIYNPGDKDSHP